MGKDHQCNTIAYISYAALGILQVESLVRYDGEVNGTWLVVDLSDLRHQHNPNRIIWIESVKANKNQLSPIAELVGVRVLIYSFLMIYCGAFAELHT